MNYSRSLGHFLENRSSFLKNVTADLMKNRVISDEMNLLNNIRSSIQHTAPPSLKDELTVSTMLDCSMHLGHSKSYWNPNMAKFILGERSGIHILDLEKTLACIRQAASVTADIARKSGRILFVGTSENLQRLTYEAATHCNQFYINKRWIGGTISNSKSIIGSTVRPDLVIILDLKKKLVAAKECSSGNIPLIAICDTDCDPRIVTYPIPSNDESLPGIELVAKALSIAAKKGQEGRII